VNLVDILEFRLQSNKNNVHLSLRPICVSAHISGATRLLIITCRGLRLTYKPEFWIIFTDTLFTELGTTGNKALSSVYTHITVCRYISTRVLESYPGNGFLTVSLSFQITYQVYFALPNSFLAIFSQSPWTAIPRTRPNS
jgi:hypothetical protein